MNLLRIVLRTVSLALATAPLAAQTTTVFPAEYSNVSEGPLNSANLPLANGVSRVLIVYDQQDLDLPNGATISHLGFRQDASIAPMDAGRALQLEIRMGYSPQSATAPSTTFDANYTTAPTTVFGPALYTLPNLRDANNPLPNGQFFIPLSTPFVFSRSTDNLVVEYRVFGNSGGGTSFNYRLDRADYYSPVHLGPAGCPHSGGLVPQLSLTPVRTGATLSASLSQAPGNSFAVIAVQAGGRLVTPFALSPFLPGINPACMGQINQAGITTLSGISTGSGTLNVSYAVPNIPSLNDLFLAHQAILFDFFAPGGVAVSNGAEVQVGIRPRASIVATQGPPSSVTTGSLSQNYCPVSFFRYQ